MLIPSQRPKTFPRRGKPLSREEAIPLIRRQTMEGVRPWGMFASVASGIALVISLISYQSSTMRVQVDKGMAPLRAELVEMDKRLTNRLDAIDRSLDRIESRLDVIDGRLGAMDRRLDQMDAKLNRLLGR